VVLIGVQPDWGVALGLAAGADFRMGQIEIRLAMYMCVYCDANPLRIFSHELVSVRRVFFLRQERARRTLTF
jgi:hypothetical protein